MVYSAPTPVAYNYHDSFPSFIVTITHAKYIKTIPNEAKLTLGTSKLLARGSRVDCAKVKEDLLRTMVVLV